MPSIAERAGGPQLLVALPVVAGLAALGWWLRRRSRRPAKADPWPPPRIVPAAEPPPGDGHVAVLEWRPNDGRPGEQIELTLADTTIGRDPEAVDIIIDDPGLSRLHARIRRTATGDYWLYDEGSESGTYLNYERLGLAPRQIQHNDVVQLGRVTLRFRLELPGTGDKQTQ